MMLGLSGHSTSARRKNAIQTQMSGLAAQFDDLSIIPPTTSQTVIDTWAELFQQFAGAYAAVSAYSESIRHARLPRLTEQERLQKRSELLRCIRDADSVDYKRLFGDSEQAVEAFEGCMEVLQGILNLRQVVRTEIADA
jgi:hypothetical protein